MVYEVSCMHINVKRFLHFKIPSYYTLAGHMLCIWNESMWRIREKRCSRVASFSSLSVCSLPLRIQHDEILSTILQHSVVFINYRNPSGDKVRWGSQTCLFPYSVYTIVLLHLVIILPPKLTGYYTHETCIWRAV